MRVLVDLDQTKYGEFIEYFVNDEDADLNELYISVFNGWLNESDYSRYISNASEKEIEIINEKRLKFFSSFMKSGVILDDKSKKFMKLDTESEFRTQCINGLDNNESLLIIDCENRVAINSSYDFTDICYFTDNSTIENIVKLANSCGLYTFSD